VWQRVPVSDGRRGVLALPSGAIITRLMSATAKQNFMPSLPHCSVPVIVLRGCWWSNSDACFLSAAGWLGFVIFSVKARLRRHLTLQGCVRFPVLLRHDAQMDYFRTPTIAQP